MLARWINLTLFFLITLISLPSARAESLWGLGVSGFQFRDKEFFPSTDSSIGASLFLNYGWKIQNEFRLLIENEIATSAPKSLGTAVWHFTHFLGLQGEYRFIPKLILSFGPGYTGNHNLKKDTISANTRHGIGVLGKIGYEFWTGDSFAMNFQVRGLTQVFNNENGGLAYQMGAGLGFQFN